MALSQEVLNNLAFANQMGFDKMHLAPPAQTRAMMKLAPKNPNPTPVGEIINTAITENSIPILILGFIAGIQEKRNNGNHNRK